MVTVTDMNRTVCSSYIETFVSPYSANNGLRQAHRSLRTAWVKANELHNSKMPRSDLQHCKLEIRTQISGLILLKEADRVLVVSRWYHKNVAVEPLRTYLHR